MKSKRSPVVLNTKFKVLPAAPGRCASCAVDHDENGAHDAESMFYQTRFYLKHGRYPTWADAIAHLSEERQESWRKALIEFGVWSEPEGEAVPEPYATSGPWPT